MRYTPSPSLTTAFDFSIKASLDASTVTPGRTAPEASFTVPVMALCACAVAGHNANHPRATSAATVTRRVMLPPLKVSPTPNKRHSMLGASLYDR
jgi:hypothetical protein